MIFSEKFSTASLSAAQQKCFEEGGGTKESVLPGCAQAGERVSWQGVGHLPFLSPGDYGRCQLKVVLLLWIPMFFCGTQFFTTSFTLCVYLTSLRLITIGLFTALSYIREAVAPLAIDYALYKLSNQDTAFFAMGFVTLDGEKQIHNILY